MAGVDGKPVIGEGILSPEVVKIYRNRSEHAKQGGLIISAAELSSISGIVNLVVGRVGFPSVPGALRVGGAMGFETPDEGIFEGRVLNLVIALNDYAEIQIARLEPRGGLVWGFAEHDMGNTPFDSAEIARIKASLDEVRVAVSKRSGIMPEQMDFVARKLDEMAQAASRLGRRDWMNLAIGMLANIVVTATLGSDVGKFLFQVTGNALSWLFGETLKLLPSPSNSCSNGRRRNGAAESSC